MFQLTSHAYTSAVLQKRPHPLVEMLKDLALNRSYFKPPGELQATSCQHFRRLRDGLPADILLAQGIHAQLLIRSHISTARTTRGWDFA